MTKLKANPKKNDKIKGELKDNASKKSNETINKKINVLVNNEGTGSNHEQTKTLLTEIVRGELDRDRFFEKFGVSVRKTKNGLGVIAERNFNFGEIIGYVEGISVFDPNYSSVWCIDGGSCVLEPFAPFCYLNHSCEPNSFFFREDFESDSEQVSSPNSDQCQLYYQNQNQEQSQILNSDSLKSNLTPDQREGSQVTASKGMKSENIFVDEFCDHQEERQIFIDENGVEFYWDTCIRENCYGCPDTRVCQSYHEVTKEEQRRVANVRVEALRPIRKGEEITVDYAWPASWAIPCCCESENCRGWIVDKNERHLLPNQN